MNRNRLLFDYLDRPIHRQVTDGGSLSSGLETFTCNARGLTNYTDPLGNLTTFVRDVAERIVYQTNAENQLLQFVYNPADELAMLIDGKSQTNIWLMMPMDASPTKLMRWNERVFISIRLQRPADPPHQCRQGRNNLHL